MLARASASASDLFVTGIGPHARTLLAGTVVALLLAAGGTPAQGSPAPAAGDLTVEADGRCLTVDCQRLSQPAATRSLEGCWTRLAAAGPVRLRIAATAEAITRAELRSIGMDAPVAVASGAATATLPGPGQYRVALETTGGGARSLFVFVDDPAATYMTAPVGPQVIDVTRRGVPADGRGDVTSALQALLDACAAHGGGVVLFPAGLYRTGPLRIGSGTTVHLAAGARLQAADDPALFQGELLLIDHARGVRLVGAGVIDGNARHLRALQPEVTHRLHGIVIRDSEDVRVEGLVLENCCDWNVHVLRSARVAVHHVRLFAHKDGFIADSSRDVDFTDCFALSTDDTAMVCARDPRPAERVRVQRGMFGSAGAALKVGSLTAAPIRDVVFTDCEIFDSDRAIAIQTRHPVGAFERVVWRRIRAELTGRGGEDAGALMEVRPVEGGGDFRLRDCRVEDVRASVVAPSRLAGTPAAPLAGLALVRLTLDVASAPARPGALFELTDVAALPAEDLTVRWHGHAAAWSGLADHPAQLPVRGLRVTP
jgi:hypothetical protein